MGREPKYAHKRYFLRYGGYFAVLPRIIATVGGIGYFPGLPGTVGSAAGVCLYWFVYQGDKFFPVFIFPFLVALAVWSSHIYARELGKTDPQEVVVDEVSGQWLCLLGSTPTVLVLLVGFLAFRLFDIWKPFRRVEKLPGGWGIVVDDILAGFLGWLTIALVRFFGYL